MKHCGNCQWNSEKGSLAKVPLTEHVHLFLFTNLVLLSCVVFFLSQ